MLSTFARAVFAPSAPAQDQSCACPTAPVYSVDPCAPNLRRERFRRGRLPIAISTCPENTINQLGRTNSAWIAEETLWAMFNKAATYTPIDPLSASDVKAAGNLTLTLGFAAAAGTAQGNRLLTPGFVIEIANSDNVAMGVSNVSLTGTFEDGQPYTQTLQFNVGKQGLARYMVLATRVSQGASYPSLVTIERDIQLTSPGVATALTAAAAPNDATTWTPTNGLRAAQRDFTFVVTAGNINTQYRIEALTPVSQYWDWAEAIWADASEGRR
jgi:hypothetical protein